MENSELESRLGPRKRRGKYGRPCDICASRRVRCVVEPGATLCNGCITYGLRCTLDRIRKKSGPKKVKKDCKDFLDELECRGSSQEELSEFLPRSLALFLMPQMFGLPYPAEDLKADPVEPEPLFEPQSPYQARITVDKFLPYLQIYQTYFYGYWPVLSVAHLVLTIVDINDASQHHAHFELTAENAMPYALSCAVCAAIATQMLFVLYKDHALSIADPTSGAAFAEESRRIRGLFDYMARPRVTTLLSSFFLYAHYVNNKGCGSQAIMYLREAILMAQMMGFHEPEKYVDKSAAETQRWKKIYYMLLVTERFMCFEDGVPVILDACIEFPTLDNEEYPSLLAGFTELIKVFSVPDKKFFGEVNQKSRNAFGMLQPLQNSQSTEEIRRWISRVQRDLNVPIEACSKVSDAQKLNILLSRLWIQSIAWHITSEHQLLHQLDLADDCFSVDFPLHVTRDFLRATSGLPQFAFEANGPGICVKLLEMANSMTFAIGRSQKKMMMAELLHEIFLLVSKFRNDITLPVNIYDKVRQTIACFKHAVPRVLPMPEYAERVADKLNEEPRSTKLSPFVPSPLMPESEPYANLSYELRRGANIASALENVVNAFTQSNYDFGDSERFEYV